MAHAQVITKLVVDGAALTDGMNAGKKSISDYATFATKYGKLAAAGIVAGIGAAMTYAVREASQAEQAIAKLRTSLRMTGEATQANLSAFAGFADEMQRVTTYGDEAITMAMAYGHNLGLQTSQLQAATKAAIGLAAAYDMDLNTAMMLIAKASNGNTEALTRYGIQLKTGMTDAEKFAEILRRGADAFSLETEKTKTFAGQLTQLKEEAGDLAKDIGGPLLTALKDVMATVKDMKQPLTDAATTIREIVASGVGQASRERMRDILTSGPAYQRLREAREKQEAGTPVTNDRPAGDPMRRQTTLDIFANWRRLAAEQAAADKAQQDKEFEEVHARGMKLRELAKGSEQVAELQAKTARAKAIADVQAQVRAEIPKLAREQTKPQFVSDAVDVYRQIQLAVADTSVAAQQLKAIETLKTDLIRTLMDEGKMDREAAGNIVKGIKEIDLAAKAQ